MLSHDEIADHDKQLNAHYNRGSPLDKRWERKMKEMIKYFFAPVIGLSVLLVIVSIWSNEYRKGHPRILTPMDLAQCRVNMRGELDVAATSRGMTLITDRTAEPKSDCLDGSQWAYMNLPPRVGYVRDQLGHCFMATSNLVQGRNVPMHLDWSFAYMPCDGAK